MHKRKSEPFDQPRLNAVIATRRDVTSRSLHHFAQGFSFFGCCRFHNYFPFSLLWILTQWVARSRHRVGFIHREEREAHEGFGHFYHKLRGLRSTSLKVFTTCINFFLAARSPPKHNYQWRSPLSALPRDGGEQRGGSFRFFGLRLNGAGAFVVSIALSSTRIPGYFTAAALGCAARTISPAFTLCMS